MGFGDYLSSAWDSATETAKSAVNSTVNGAKYVGQKTVEGAQYVGQKTVEGAQMTWDGAKYVGQKTVEGAQYVGQKTVEGAQYVGQKTVEGAQMAWDGTKYVAQKSVEGAQYVGQKTVEGVQAGAQYVGDKAKGAGRAGLHGLANKVYTDKNIQRAQKAKAAFQKAKDWFSDKPPAQPCVNCGTKDVDHDGKLMGFKDGKCVPLTNKGQPVDKADIAAAKQSGYDPQLNPADDTSAATTACCKQCSPGGPKRTIYYVNGINTTKQTHCDTLKQIGDSTCANVVGIYNATEPKGTEKPGEFALEDARQTAKDRELIRSAQNGNTKLAHDGRNPAVDTLSDLVVQETKDGRPPEIWAHSQGGAVTSLALFDANNQLKAGTPGPGAPLKDVKVNSFGAASPTWVKGPQYTHYVNVNDFTPTNFGIGDNPSKHPQNAGGGEVVLFSGEPHVDGNKAPFSTENRQRHVLPDATKYHGVDNIYIPMYEQKNKNKEACSCNR